MFDFNIIVVSVIGAGSLAFSFLEYALTRKKKQQKTETKTVDVPKFMKAGMIILAVTRRSILTLLGHLTSFKPVKPIYAKLFTL